MLLPLRCAPQSSFATWNNRQLRSGQFPCSSVQMIIVENQSSRFKSKRKSHWERRKRTTTPKSAKGQTENSEKKIHSVQLSASFPPQFHRSTRTSPSHMILRKTRSIALKESAGIVNYRATVFSGDRTNRYQSRKKARTRTSGRGDIRIDRERHRDEEKKRDRRERYRPDSLSVVL